MVVVNCSMVVANCISTVGNNTTGYFQQSEFFYAFLPSTIRLSNKSEAL